MKQEGSCVSYYVSFSALKTREQAHGLSRKPSLNRGHGRIRTIEHKPASDITMNKVFHVDEYSMECVCKQNGS